ncbi:putative xylanase/chitin deacetylase [Solitalea canadensis DSM 3403]|uniref:Putative xylanase/chitin deacetylase n=2 Tax=Solitalea canadensis TaxID=995 RepID=H8KR54_SOLCM|nr:putative xylanase/chitin deacetylase [Solitalea canadensis DSM 3403]
MIGAALMVASCTTKNEQKSTTKASDSSEVKKADSAINIVPAKVANANELGKVMVLEYHLIGYPEDRWRRTPENFEKDLQMLYDNGYYPVSVLDLASGNLNVPAGKTPFAITFDDSSAGQFRFIDENGQPVVDPKCAVGIMEAFKKKHVDFPLTATFYVLPAIKPSLRLFAQPEYKKQKLEWLIKHGYEIGSHSWYHAPLSKLSDADVQKHLSMFVKEIKAFIPDYEVQSLALPLGERAKNKTYESKGSFEGTNYDHKVVLLVGSSSSVSPYDKTFSSLAMQRVQAGDEFWGPGAMVKSQLKNNSRFISDGDPATITIPESQQDKLNSELKKNYKIAIVK